MDGSATQQGEKAVADLLEPEPIGDELPVVLRQLDGARVAEEVRGVQEVDVERVALDPFGAVQEAAERSRRRLDLDPEQVLERMDRAHLVRDGADAADARDDVEDLVRRAADHERLEVPGRLEDLQARLGDGPVPNEEVQRALALDAGQVLDLEAEVSRVHLATPRDPTRADARRRTRADAPSPA